MYPHRNYLFVPFLTMILFSCQGGNKLPQEAERLAERECRAIALRKQRFALADQIRFTQDSLLSSSMDTLAFSNRLRQYNEEKERLTNESLLLADTIQLQLDSLRKFIIKSTEEQKQFDQLLEEELKKRNCGND